MRKRSIHLGMMMLVFTMAAGLVITSPAFAGKVVFETMAAKTKVGDGEDVQSYAPGFHNLAVDGDNIYTVYNADNLYNDSEVQLGISNDGGVTWGKSSVVAIEGNSSAAALAVGSDSEIHIVWDSSNQIKYSHGTVNNNNVWIGSTPVVVSSESTSTASYSVAIAVDDVGGVHITFDGAGTSGDGVYYKKSTDGGNTFEPMSFVASTNDGQANLVAEGSGKLYIAYLDANDDIVFSTKAAGSSTWSTPVKVNGSISTDFLSMAVLDASNIFIAWDSGNGEYVAATSDGGNTWAQHLVTADSGGWPSLVVDSSGVLNLGWIDWSKGIHFTRSTNGGSNWPVIQIIDDGSVEQPDWPHLAIDSSGKLVVMYNTYRPGVVYFTKEK